MGAGQIIGEMGVVENCCRSATARAASEVEAEFLTPTEFLDQIADSPQAARELIQRLSQRLREADDCMVDERRSRRAHETGMDAKSQTVLEPGNNAYLAAKSPCLQRQLHTALGLADLPFVVGRVLAPGDGLPRLQPDLKLDDSVPALSTSPPLSRAHAPSRDARRRAQLKLRATDETMPFMVCNRGRVS